ncbi:MAG: hypothetical protein IKO53_04440 [Lachnospiraceae bacterium]|nr:hypothetical protein [Lachnospiraceae bacterium]
MTEKDNKILLIRCIVSLAFYASFCFIFGPTLGADSKGYINMIAAREPVYPLILAFFRVIFPDSIYLNVVVLFQNVIQALAVCFCVEFFKKRFELNNIVAVLMYLIHFGVAIMCQFISERGAIYSNMIMTEGVTMSLWIIFITLLIKAVLDDSKPAYISVAIVLTIMMATRKQMAVGYIVTMAAVVLCRIGRDNIKKYLIRIVLVAAGLGVSVMLVFGIMGIYNFALRGKFAKNTRDMNLVLTTTLYVADKDDVSLIDDEVARKLFAETMSILDKNGSNISYAGKGWESLAEHYEYHYDLITIDTTKDLFEEYARNEGYSDEMEIQTEADRLSGVIVKSLIMDNLGKYVRIYFSSVLTGLVNTVAHKSTLLNIYAFVVYVMTIVLIVLCYFNKSLRDTADASLIVVGTVFANVGVTAALIFCQSRYMIYNMALFYMVLLLMIVKSFQEKKKK